MKNTTIIEILDKSPSTMIVKSFNDETLISLHKLCKSDFELGNRLREKRRHQWEPLCRQEILHRQGELKKSKEESQLLFQSTLQDFLEGEEFKKDLSDKIIKSEISEVLGSSYGTNQSINIKKKGSDIMELASSKLKEIESKINELQTKKNEVYAKCLQNFPDCCQLETEGNYSYTRSFYQPRLRIIKKFDYQSTEYQELYPCVDNYNDICYTLQSLLCDKRTLEVLSDCLEPNQSYTLSLNQIVQLK